MNYWERWIGDWKRKTAHLSAEAKGIYGELLDHEYATQKPLPLEHDALCRIAGARTQSECKCVDHIIAEYYLKTDQGYVNPRVQQEITKREAYVAGQRDRANKRWADELGPRRINGAARPIIQDTGEVIERIPMVGGEEFDVRESFAKELERLYPNVDIPATLRQMRGWCIGNPQKLKTPRGIRRFITTWCDKDQNGR